MSFRRWVLPVGCLMLGGLAGVALAGRAESLPDPTIAARPTHNGSTTSAPPVVATTARVATTVASTSAPTSSAPATTAPATTVPGVTTSVPVRQAAVVVANGSNTSGVAGAAATLLRAKGWTTVEADDVAGATAPTAVYADDAFRASADEVIADLALLAVVKPMSDAPPLRAGTTGDVIVVLGPEVAG